MKRILSMGLMLLSGAVFAQQENGVLTTQEELQAESMATDGETEQDDDEFVLSMADFRKHPMSLNMADAAELRELRVLSELQVQSLIRYRILCGKLISIYELQAVPGWDLLTISRLKPYISIYEPARVISGLKERLRTGQSSVMLRTSIVPQLSEGFIKDDSGTAKYSGNPSRMMVRYQYNYKNLLQFGLLGDKDAGEQFFKGVQKGGFDFYSFHIFVRKLGRLKALAVGDYTVSMGQGLIHWQGSGMRKNADVMLIKRQGEVLKPYRSAGEYNFQRGVGSTLQFNHWTFTAFASYRRLTATLDADSSGSFVSSIVTSGYHRTLTEQQKRKNLAVYSGGMVVRYALTGGNISVNTIQYRLALPIKPQPKPYDLYGISGSSWSNYSVDFDYTFRNLHTYGELAADRNGNIALLTGAMLSLHRNLDVSLVYRNLPSAYQSMAGGSFTENSVPSNEKGFYSGLVYRPRVGWIINIYGDVFRSPWVRFTTDAPASGSGYLIQVLHQPNKRTEIYSRLSAETKSLNVAGSIINLPEINRVLKREWRFQVSNQVTPAIMLRSRVSISSWGAEASAQREQGFLGFVDGIWKPGTTSLSGSIRLQYFDTDSYNTRINAYENGPLYDMSIPAFYDKGWRYYINVLWRPFRKTKRGDLRFYGRIGSVIQSEKTFFGSGLDKINRSSKNDLKLQVMLNF